jgi:hypothetical protein
VKNGNACQGICSQVLLVPCWYHKSRNKLSPDTG